MKRKWKIAVAVVCALFLVTVAYAAAGGAGSQSDPLVTLSYLTNVFAPKVEDLAEKTVAEHQEQNKEELETAIEEWDARVQEALKEAGVSTGSGTTYRMVTLEPGQVLVVGEGCEVLLCSGAASWSSDSAMMDATSGATLANGKALTANHLYMSLGGGAVYIEENQTTTTEPTQTTGTVTAGPLNVRSGPGSSNSIVGTLNEGDQVVILDTVDGWYQITSGSLSGYISADYVTVNEAAATPSEAPAPTAAILMVRGTYQIQYQ